MSRRANGEGTVWKRKDGRWCGATYALTNTGGRKRVYVYGRTRAAAREKLTALQAELDRGIRVSVENWTVEAYLQDWLEHVVKPNRAPKTHQGYELAVRRHITPSIGKKRLRSLSVYDVRTLVAELQGKGLQRRGVQFVHGVLRAGLQSAMRDELVSRNVAKLVQVPAPRYDVGRGLAPEQVRALLAAAQPDRLSALFVVAIYLGLRRGELLGLEWKHVDLDQGTLEVVHTLQRVDGRLQLMPPKTRASRRPLPMPAPVVRALRAHRAAQKAERLRARPAWVDSGMVFTTTVGTPFDPDNLDRSWNRIRAVLGSPAPRLHDLRHTCVSLLLAEGVAPHIVMEIAGHSRLDVTMLIYAHTNLDDKRKALNLLGDLL